MKYEYEGSKTYKLNAGKTNNKTTPFHSGLCYNVNQKSRTSLICFLLPNSDRNKIIIRKIIRESAGEIRVATLMNINFSFQQFKTAFESAQRVLNREQRISIKTKPFLIPSSSPW
jgi:hypothetical protein